jgi:CubicO group peptidase (beta-lactamase class C family)
MASLRKPKSSIQSRHLTISIFSKPYLTMNKQSIFSFFILAITFCLTYSTAQAQAWIARHGLNPAQYQTEYNTNKQNGYRLTCVNGYTHNGQERYTAVWEQIAGPQMATHHGMSGAQYQAKVDEYLQQGYRLTAVSGYGVGNAAKFAAIWEKKAGGLWAAKHNLTAAQYQTEVTNYKNQGYQLIHVSGYVVNNVEYFAAIWEKKTGLWAAKHNLTAAQFQTEFNTLGSQGYVLTNMSGYTKNNVNYYAGIWVKTTSQPLYVRHGITAENYQHVHDNMYYQGYRPLFVQGFASGTSSRFNGIWINKNYSASDLAKINNAVNNYMQAQNVPGLSLAIMKDGRLVFAKGYGNARPGVEMSPNHPLRIFSISKSLTAVAIMRLVQQGNPTLLDRKVFGPNSVLGAKYPTSQGNTGGFGTLAAPHPLHQFTVRQLLLHTSGMRSGNGEPPFQNPNSTVAECMADLMGRADLMTTTPNQQWIYSNLGYYFLGRVIEEVSGQPYETYVRNNVLNPSGIGNTMYVGLANGQSKAGEATYNPQSTSNMQQFGAFGGWVARPIDLVKFLSRVDGVANPNDIITIGNHNIMTTSTPLSSSNAMGWMVNGGQQYFGGSFGGSRSWLVKMPNNGLSYAIIINSNAEAWALKAVLDTALPTISQFPGYNLF